MNIFKYCSRGTSSVFLAIILSLLISVESSEKTCLGCVAAGKGWQLDFCQDTRNKCPIDFVRCSRSAEECVKDGCKAPDHDYTFSIYFEEALCTSCCRETSSGCTTLSYSGKSPENAVYDEETESESCDSETYCPPCAQCLKQDEQNLFELYEQDFRSSCTKEQCETGISFNTIDACSNWCSKVSKLVGNCPHLEEEFWKEPMPETCVECVGIGKSWQADACQDSDLSCPLADDDCCTDENCCNGGSETVPETLPEALPEALPETCVECVGLGKSWQSDACQASENMCPLEDVTCCIDEDCCIGKIATEAPEPLPETCEGCVGVGKSWQEESCQDSDLSCPLQDVNCCTDEKCCTSENAEPLPETCVECVGLGKSWQLEACQDSEDKCPLDDAECCTDEDCCAGKIATEAPEPLPETCEGCVDAGFAWQEDSCQDSDLSCPLEGPCCIEKECCTAMVLESVGAEPLVQLLPGTCAECVGAGKSWQAESCQSSEDMCPLENEECCTEEECCFSDSGSEDEYVPFPSPGEACMSCLGSLKAWHNNKCHNDAWEQCQSPRRQCCTDAECCVNEGCRGPDDVFKPSRKTSISCNTCCEQKPGSNDCVMKSFDGVGDTPWYNVIDLGECPDSSECPPCAMCSLDDEVEMEGLINMEGQTQKCSKDVCDEAKGTWDPCYESDSCGCWCQQVDKIASSCPHLRAKVWLEKEEDTVNVIASLQSGASRMISGILGWIVILSGLVLSAQSL